MVLMLTCSTPEERRNAMDTYLVRHTIMRCTSFDRDMRYAECSCVSLLDHPSGLVGFVSVMGACTGLPE